MQEQNSNKKKYFVFIFGLIFLSFFSILYYGLFYASDPKEIPSALINQKAPNFKVVTFKNEIIELNKLKNTPIILNFWGSWCPSCKEESQILETIHQQYKDLGVTVIGIAMNDTYESALKFSKKYGKTFYLALDHENAQIALDYGIVGAPETFFIDKQGIIRKKVLGVIDFLTAKNFLDSEI